jgi:hypothetical protein
MITIHGLTERQRGIMDLLWNCNDIEQIQTLIQALPSKQDQYDARSLVLIATVESIEQELGYSKECKDAAKTAIANAML